MKTAGLYGLVLSGGKSQRMGKDKGALVYPSISSCEQRRRCFDLLDLVCEKTFVSCRDDKAKELAKNYPVIVDLVDGEGPGAGILSAMKQYPDVAWFVFACDFPFADENTVRFLAQHRSIDRPATFYIHGDHTFEPLFAIWEKPALKELAKGFAQGNFSPRQALERIDQHYGCERLHSPDRQALVNVNSRDEARVHGLI